MNKGTSGNISVVGLGSATAAVAVGKAVSVGWRVQTEASSRHAWPPDEESYQPRGSVAAVGNSTFMSL